MKVTSPHKLTALLACSFAGISTLPAATLNFTGGTSGTARTWTSSSWSTGTTPSASDDLVIGGTALNSGIATIGNGSYLAIAPNNTSDWTYTIRSLTFDNSLNQFPGGTLDLRNSSYATPTNSTIVFGLAGIDIMKAIAGNVSISSRSSTAQTVVNLNYVGMANIDVDSTHTLTLNGNNNSSAMVTGTGGITKTGEGTLYLNAGNAAANNYSGGTVIAAGTVMVGASGSLGTGAVQLGVDGGGAASLISNRAGWTYANDITVTSGTGTRTIGNNADTGSYNTNYSGDITVNGDLTVHSMSVEGYVLRFSGALSGTGDITKTGAGVWRLEDSANTWTGNLFVEEGGFVLDADARFNFVLGEDSAVNTVTGTSVSTADFSGDIVIDNGGLTTGSWQLVDVDSFGDATFGASVTLRLLGESAEFVAVGDGLYQFGGWSFNSYTGMLTGTGMIPEPSTFAALAGLGAIGLAAMRRRRA